MWRFSTVPHPGERNDGSWGAEGWKDRAGPSSWGMYSLDEKTGTVFIPVGNPADSYIGNDRPGDNLYSDSVVALDLKTGKLRWHYQLVHHDIWEQDAGTPVVLYDSAKTGKGLAVAQEPAMAPTISVRIDDKEEMDELARLNNGVAPSLAYEQRIGLARRMVSDNPKQVAQVVKSWVGEDGG